MALQRLKGGWDVGTGHRPRHFTVRREASPGTCFGWQLFDPATGLFVREGTWVAADNGEARLDIELPAEPGLYRVHVSEVSGTRGWRYERGGRFLVMDAEVRDGSALLQRVEETTLRSLRARRWPRLLVQAVAMPLRSVWQNRSLIRSMVRRDILARYRGSFGDVLWTVLHPLLLMSTYFFVFGIVLQTRFAADPSRAGFVLYFLAGMLPWIAFSEAAGRAPVVILENRNLVKKLLFPLETLPVNLTATGSITQLLALLVFLLALWWARGSVPLSALWLPVLLAPQWLLTLGVCWLLSALGVFFRDLGHINGFLLTLVFFLTPICYPESSLPAGALAILSKNPIYVLVRGFRAVLLESSAPPWHSLWKLYLVSALVFVAGHAVFHRLRRGFADVM